jgi:hypothetical protein
MRVQRPIHVHGDIGEHSDYREPASLTIRP